MVARVSKEEFLLSAPGDLGMFVTSAGVSERPPIQWSKPVQKFVFCQPYVVAMSDDSIVVYRYEVKMKLQLSLLNFLILSVFSIHSYAYHALGSLPYADVVVRDLGAHNCSSHIRRVEDRVAPEPESSQPRFSFFFASNSTARPPISRHACGQYVSRIEFSD